MFKRIKYCKANSSNIFLSGHARFNPNITAGGEQALITAQVLPHGRNTNFIPVKYTKPTLKISFKMHYTGNGYYLKHKYPLRNRSKTTHYKILYDPHCPSE